MELASRSSGSEEGIFLGGGEEEEDDLSDGVIASQMLYSGLPTSRGSQGSAMEEPFQEPFTLPKASEGDRVSSRRSSQRTPLVNPTEMFFGQKESPRGSDLSGLSSNKSSARNGLHENAPRLEYAVRKAAASCSEHTECIEVSDELKELFRFIDCYKPKELEITTILKPFIPDFIPAVGGVDEFIKVPRPDGQQDYLGLKVLDERGPKQSDAAVVNLQLRASSMQSSLHPVQVASVENAAKNPKKLDAWINSIKELHRAQAPPSVIYSKPMPSMDKLMQEWPVEMEELLSSMELPTEKLDLDVGTFADVCCSILDIPVYKSRVDSLHVMFSLFLELRASMPYAEEWPSSSVYPRRSGVQ